MTSNLRICQHHCADFRVKTEPAAAPAPAASLPIAAQVAAAAGKKVVVLKSSMLKGLNQAMVLNKVSGLKFLLLPTQASSMKT